jgi:hypothetical protein
MILMTDMPVGDSSQRDVDPSRSESMRLVATAIGLFVACFVLGAVAAWGVCVALTKPLVGLVMLGSSIGGLGYVAWRFYAASGLAHTPR